MKHFGLLVFCSLALGATIVCGENIDEVNEMSEAEKEVYIARKARWCGAEAGKYINGYESLIVECEDPNLNVNIDRCLLEKLEDSIKAGEIKADEKDAFYKAWTCVANYSEARDA